MMLFSFLLLPRFCQKKKLKIQKTQKWSDFGGFQLAFFFSNECFPLGDPKNPVWLVQSIVVGKNVSKVPDF
jgi:hypothetical protein